MRMRFRSETQKTSKCHVLIDWSRFCNLSTRSATYHLLCCALDYRRSSSDFEHRNWYLQLSRKVCHLRTVWWKGRTWQILFLCFLSNYNYHCIFLFHKFLVVRKKSCRRSFGSSFAWNTHSFWYNKVNFRNKLKQLKPKSSSAGLEPATSGLDVQRAIHCATRTFGMSECYLKRLSGIRKNALCTCFSFSSSFF